ncbi:MAG: ABC transporter permease, partial [Inquilinus limosus]|nr:ABC transporter permease [Inquilinus limosus]
MSDATLPPREPAREPQHYVNPAAWDPYVEVPLTAQQERYFLASQWRIMWWKLKRHRLAAISGVVLLLAYLSILVSEVLAPYGLDSRHTGHIYAPPQQVRFFHEGSFVGPYVYGYQYSLDMESMRRVYTEDRSQPQPLRFFCRGDAYRFWGLVEADFHLVCPPERGTFFLLGTDRLGRDMLSRILYGARISLTVGLIGISVSFLLGIVIGGLAGYYGGWIDNLVNRLIEVIQSFPQLPLWMALSASLPVTWSPILVFLGITIILGLVEWTGLARSVRSKLLALREEDFCVAAQLMGARPRRIIFRHLLPSFMSHLIASATLT